MYRTNGLSLMATARPRPLLIGSIHFPDRMHPPPIASLMFWRNPPTPTFLCMWGGKNGACMHDPPLIYSTVERQKLPLRMRKKWKRERAQGEEKEKKRNLCRGLKVEKCTGSTHLKATTLGSRRREQESSTEHRARSPSVRGGRERERGEIWRIDSLILLLPLLPPFPPSKSERILRLLPILRPSLFSPPLPSPHKKARAVFELAGHWKNWAVEKPSKSFPSLNSPSLLGICAIMGSGRRKMGQIPCP